MHWSKNEAIKYSWSIKCGGGGGGGGVCVCV